MLKYSILCLVTLVAFFLGNAYYSMRQSNEQKTRPEPYAKGSPNELVASNFREQIFSSVRGVIKEELGDILEQIGLIKAKIIPSRLAIAGQTAELVSQEQSNDVIPMIKNRINYADEVFGAYIEHVDAELVENRNIFSWIGIATNDNPPEQILRSSMDLGCCFAFKKKKATVVIALPERISIEAIQLQHIPKYRSPMHSTASAPRYISVFAINASNSEHFLGDFEYKNRSPSQVFAVAAKNACQRVRFVFSGNHGNPEYTCVYRVSVYGQPAI